MAATDPAADLPEDGESAGQPGRVRRAGTAWRKMMRIAYRDPEHVAERLTLQGANVLSEQSVVWAREVRRDRPDTPLGEIAEEQRIQTAQVARIDGAVAGTPFFVAIVPGYLAYLWQEAVMETRIAALYGHDPRTIQTCAENLTLRGVHPTTEEARAALEAVRDTPLPDKPVRRRPIRVWVRSGYALLVFGGFMSASTTDRESDPHWRRRTVIGVLGAGAIWVITWVLPVSFMIAMAWGCESHARSLGTRTISHYGGPDAEAEVAAFTGGRRERGRTRREVLRAILLALSIAIPIAFIAYADHVRQSTGVNWLGALGALVAASLVMATTVIARRR